MIDEELKAINFDEVTKKELKAIKKRVNQHVKRLKASVTALNEELKAIDRKIKKKG